MVRRLRLEHLEDRSLLSQLTPLAVVEPSDAAERATEHGAVSSGTAASSSQATAAPASGTSTSTTATTYQRETGDDHITQSGVTPSSTSDDRYESPAPATNAQPGSSVPVGSGDDSTEKSTTAPVVPPAVTGSTGGATVIEPGDDGAGSASTPVTTGSGVASSGPSAPVALAPAVAPAPVVTSGSTTALGPVGPAPVVAPSAATDSNTPAPVSPVATASSGQDAVASPPAVIAVPASSTATRSDPTSLRTTVAAGNGNVGAAESLQGASSASGGLVEVAATVSSAGQEASPTVARGDHGVPSVASLAPWAGAPASGNRDFGAVPVFEFAREVRVPRLPGILNESSGAASGRQAGFAGHPSSRAAWADTLKLRGADVQTACSPYERGTIERAIDAFLGELGGSSGSSWSALRTWSEAIPGVIAAGVALGILEMERRRSLGRRDVPRVRNQNDPEAPLPGFPGCPLA
jgi:hypothetical protein